MTTAVLCPLSIQKFWADNGTPLAYGKVYTYKAGSSTPTATYTDSTGGVTNTNPIVLNARGECSIWTIPNALLKLNVTDSAGNQISGYPVDQVGSQFLLTLYGGVDTGSANAYIINYSAPYTSYTQGTPVIYFIASNSNTGASTINVNNLGIVSIVNPNQSALTAGQIVAGQMVQIVWQTGQFILTSIGATAGLQIGTFGAETSLASANVTDLGSTGTHTILVTGSSVITSLGTSASINAPIFMVRFSGTPILTYNATSLITPSGTNINVNAGDAMLAEYLGSGNWKVLLYQSAVAANQYVVRTTTATIASNTTPAADSQLTIPIGQTGTYIINCWLNDASGTSAGGLKGGIYFTGSSLAGYWAMQGTGTGTTNVALTAIGTPAQLQSAQTGVGSMYIQGMIQVTSTGTLSFNWAQNGSNVTGSVVAAGSYLEITQVSAQAGSFAPITYSFNVPATTTFAIPTGATTMTVEIWGGSGGGGIGDGFTTPGAGGGSGGYSKTIATVTGHGTQTMNYTVGGVSGTSSVSTGTFTIATMTASGGTAAVGTTPGSGGTASGGTSTNTSGNAGQVLSTGGAGIVGIYATGASGGFGVINPPANPGANGTVLFHFA
jgi:hypothetical protein